MDTQLTKRQVRALLRTPGTDTDATDADIARFFDIKHAAVWQWPEDAPIPKGRQWELRARRPDLFPSEADEAGARAA